MADVKDYGNTAAGNNQAPPDFAGEGWQSPEVNNWGRELQAAMRRFANDLPWFEYGDGDLTYTATFVAADQFKIEGADVSAVYYAGRRVRVVAPTPGTIYGGISASSFTGGDTEVDVTWDTDSLTSEPITSVALAMGQSAEVSGIEQVVQPRQISASVSDYVISGDIIALFDPILIYVSGLRPAVSDDTLAVQVSQTTGSPWVSSGYKYSGPLTQADSATPSVINNNAAGNMVLTTGVDSGTAGRVSGLITIQDHWSANRTMLTSNLSWRAGNADQRTATVGGWSENAVHQAVRLYFAGGNISEGLVNVMGSRRT